MALAIQPASVHAQVLIGTATTPAVGCYSLSNGGSCRGMFSDRNSLGSAFASYRLATCFSFRTAVSRVADLRRVAFRAVVKRAVSRLTVLRPPVLRPAILRYPPSINSSSQHVHRTRSEPKSGNHRDPLPFAQRIAEFQPSELEMPHIVGLTVSRCVSPKFAPVSINSRSVSSHNLSSGVALV